MLLVAVLGAGTRSVRDHAGAAYECWFGGAGLNPTRGSADMWRDRGDTWQPLSPAHG